MSCCPALLPALHLYECNHIFVSVLVARDYVINTVVVLHEIQMIVGNTR